MWSRWHATCACRCPKIHVAQANRLRVLVDFEKPLALHACSAKQWWLALYWTVERVVLGGGRHSTWPTVASAFVPPWSDVKCPSQSQHYRRLRCVVTKQKKLCDQALICTICTLPIIYFSRCDAAHLLAPKRQPETWFLLGGAVGKDRPSNG